VNDGNEKLPDDDICYIVGKSGVFLKKKLGLMESICKVDIISTLKDIKPSAILHIPKIPGQCFAKVVDFFRQVYSKFSGESIILLFYNEDKKLFKLDCPKQEVTGGSLHYTVKNIKGYNLIGTIHSHGSMSAFHSGTDDADERNFDGIHITIGKVNDNNTFQISCSIVSNGTRIMYEPEEYINGIIKIEESKISSYTMKSKWSDITCNKKWIKNVKLYERTQDDYNSYYRNLYSRSIGFIFDDDKDKDKFTKNLLQNSEIRPDEPGYNPCLTCPFKSYKLDLMEEEMNYSNDNDYDFMNFGPEY